MAITSIGSGLGAASHSELAETSQATPDNQINSAAVGNFKTAAAPSDVAAAILSEVSTNDLAKLSRILEPASTGETVKVLDHLLTQAIDQVESGNIGRAVGYLADYATRDPRRAETLASMPELEPVREQIATLVGQMTNVAKMSAEDGLAKAEHSAEEFPGKLPSWDTSPEVLVKLAQQLYDAGGYANYSRTSELTRALTAAADMANVKSSATLAQGPGVHTLQAMGVAQGNAAGVMAPGVILPYVVPPFTGRHDVTFDRLMATDKENLKEARRRAKAEAKELVRESWEDLKEVVAQAFRTLWHRAPLLVMLTVWLTSGVAGALSLIAIKHFAPHSGLAAMSDLGFAIWGVGFLAIVGFGFWARVRRPGYY